VSPFRAMRAPLEKGARRAIAQIARALLAWQARLGRFPAVPTRGIPDATPFVSVYARGRPRGAAVGREGTPAERLVRALVHALHDSRLGAATRDERSELSLEVAYPRALSKLSRERARARLEPGTHGIAVTRAGREPAVFLPGLAREEGLDADALLERAGAGALYLFELDRIVVPEAPGGAPLELALGFLRSRIGSDGAVEYGSDPRRRERFARGEYFHARSALVIEALDTAGVAPRVVARARRFLDAEIRAALAGRPVPGWPRSPAEVVGALAMALRARIDTRRELLALAEGVDFSPTPWHAAQAVSALGPGAPPELWRACVRDLRNRPWAPWTAIAARAVADGPTLERAERALADSCRRAAPWQGAAELTPIPELSLTALIAEGLAGSAGRAARAARQCAQAFLLAQQLVGENLGAACDHAMALGGFPMTPLDTRLRTDVTAHAVLALART
jgi:AMMECR1